MERCESIIIDGVEYTPRKEMELAETFEGMKYCIVRTYSAGVFAGFVEKIWESEGLRLVIMRQARRIWYWDGAASLSQLAMEGTSKPENCKFPIEVDRVELSRVIEILDCTKKAKKSIEEVKIWKQ